TIPIQVSELLALLVSEELLAPMRATEVAAALSRLRDKVAALLLPNGRAYAEELKQHLVATLVGPGDYGDPSDTDTALSTIENAIGCEHSVAMRYWSPKGPVTEREVDPYLLWYADGRLYLVGWCHLRNGVRTFSVDRIRAIEMLDRSFERDPGFDPHTFTGSGLGAWSGERQRVELEFSPPVAHLAHERRYHPTQQIVDEADGTARVTMFVAGLPHVAAWVASFGGQVRVRSPETLIDMVREIHRSGLAAHESAAP
ncbi:MAG: WYL domain-containing protein, partial [Myxococcota bacterium]